LLNAVVCSRVRELREAISAGTVALEISGRNARVAALQKRWDRLRAGRDPVLDHVRTSTAQSSKDTSANAAWWNSIVPKRL